MKHKLAFTLLPIITVVVLYIPLIQATIAGDVFIVIFLTLGASPILSYVLALCFENDPAAQGGRGVTPGEVFRSVFSLKTQAWSFIFGDSLILPAAFIIATYKWNEAQRQNDLQMWWAILCLAFGIAAGLSFHYGLEKGAYTKAGYGESLSSPTKLFHDFVSYPVLLGGLAYVFLPLLVTVPDWGLHLNGHTVVIALLIVTWLVLGMIVDRRRSVRLLPWGHPKYDLKNTTCIL